MDNGGEQMRLIVYGHPFCGLARRLAEVLAEHRIDYEWRAVPTGEPRFRDELRQLARGDLSVPTVILPDGTVMVEPSPREVLSELFRHQANLIERLLKR